MLRRQPILHGDNATAAVVRQLAELMVMRGETAADKAATVEIDNGRQRASRIEGRDHAKKHALEFDVLYPHAVFLFPG